jgi:hypothetical protein
MVSNLCCDSFPRLFSREFASHLLASVLRYENCPDSLGRLLIARPDVEHCGADRPMAERLLTSARLQLPATRCEPGCVLEREDAACL